MDSRSAHLRKYLFSFSFDSFISLHTGRPCIPATPTTLLSTPPSILRRLYHFVSTFSKTPLLTHSLSLSLSHSLPLPSICHAKHSVFCCRCHCLPLCAADLRQEPARRRDKKHSTPNSR